MDKLIALYTKYGPVVDDILDSVKRVLADRKVTVREVITEGAAIAISVTEKAGLADRAVIDLDA